MTEPTTTDELARKRAGAILIVCGIASAGLMLIHPAQANDVLRRPVHGLLIFSMALQIFALWSIFGMRRGSLSALGIILFGAGAAGGMIAGVINGFALPKLAQSIDLTESAGLIRMYWELNQAFAINGAILSAAAITAWSITLVRASRPILGLSGLAIGLATGVPLAVGLVSMNLHAAILIYDSQLLWLAALGWVVRRDADQAF